MAAAMRHRRAAAYQGGRAKDSGGTLKKLLRYMRAYLPGIIAALLCSVLGVVLSLFGPKVLGMAITKLFDGVLALLTGSGGIDFTAISRVLLFLAAIYAVSSLLAYIQGWIMSGIAVKLSCRMRADISRKIDRLPMKYFDRVSHGEILSRITNDVDTVAQTLNQSLSQAVSQFTQLIGVVIMMFVISPAMTLVALGILPLCLIVLLLVVKKSQKFFRAQQKYLGHVNGHVEEMYAAHEVVTAFNAQEKSIEKFTELNEELYKSGWKSQFFSSLTMPLMNFINNLGYVAICVLGGFLTLKGSISVGDIQAFIQYVRHFTQPINQLANVSNQLQMTVAAAERVFEFLEEEEESPDVPDAVSGEEIDGSVTFAHVHFGYLPEKTVINDFSAVIRPGTRVAIVGPTGAGKTTIIKLLMRFYDVSSGAILLSGYDLRQFGRSDMRDAFGMVLQDTWLYNASVKENIRFGRLDATDEEVRAAARAAQADHFIRTLPQGYDTVLSEDAGNISQGQKQLITIARTVLSDPKILILDEATSSVDTRTELAIQQAMDKLTRGRTSFIIAHRLSTIRDADIILVMNGGDIVETGSHAELLARGGFYAELYNSQFENTEDAG
ncbi:MAG: ABC transporter ATP-binding protein [Candidatus Limivicinus sp.]|jgi:ATP-binding cassette subfamily B multidrug efflux pump